MGIGAFFNYQMIAAASASSTTSSGTGSASASAYLMTFAGEFNYFFQDALKGLHVGGKAGFGLFTVSASASGTSTSGVSVNIPTFSATAFSLVFGGGGGYDYPLGGGFTVGGEANVMLATASGAGLLIDGLAVVKYGF